MGPVFQAQQIIVSRGFKGLILLHSLDLSRLFLVDFVDAGRNHRARETDTGNLGSQKILFLAGEMRVSHHFGLQITSHQVFDFSGQLDVFGSGQRELLPLIQEIGSDEVGEFIHPRASRLHIGGKFTVFGSLIDTLGYIVVFSWAEEFTP